ncbi:hypothetical protein N7488_000202 [Penicillium malachiteum]|nr:hypothetical protein N7488_000202 [Penicillium malachiteum]
MSDAGILHLPAELIYLITEHLTPQNIKNLRLVCKRLILPLNITRVFLSPNPTNISVLRAIADNDKFRLHIKELIWDHATLVQASENSLPPTVVQLSNVVLDAKTHSSWMVNEYRKNVQNLDARRVIGSGPAGAHGSDSITAALLNPESPENMEKNWRFYANLVRQEKEI